MFQIDNIKRIIQINSKKFNYYNTDNFSSCHSRGIYEIGTDDYYESGTAEEMNMSFFEYIKALSIEIIPNNISFSIISRYNDKIESPLEEVMFPFTKIEFLKKEDAFYVVFSSLAPAEDWELNWTFEYYFENIMKICDVYSDINLKGVDPSSQYNEETKYIFIKVDYYKYATIEQAFYYALSMLKKIISEVEANLHGISDYIRLINEWEHNLDNGEEGYWKGLLSKYSWIISQCFSTPHLIFQSEAYVGGQNITGKNGNFIDYAYINKTTNNISLIEIKAPTTKLIGRRFRNTYSLSSELAGSINQLLRYKDILVKDYYHNLGLSSQPFRVYSPRSILIIGNYDFLNDAQKNCFEIFRNEFKNIEIVTYDELLLKIKHMLHLFGKRGGNFELG